MIDNPNLDVSAMANPRTTNSMARSGKNKNKQDVIDCVMTTEENEEALDTLDDLIQKKFVNKIQNNNDMSAMSSYNQVQFKQLKTNARQQESVDMLVMDNSIAFDVTRGQLGNINATRMLEEPQTSPKAQDASMTSNHYMGAENSFSVKNNQNQATANTAAAVYA